MFRARHPKNSWSKARDLIWPRIGLRRSVRYLMLRLSRMKASPHKLALGFSLGVFASFTPFIGLHILIAAALALALRANLIASAIGTAIGNPITFPVIWLASYNLGGFLLRHPSHHSIVADLPGHGASLLSDGPIAVIAGLGSELKPLLLPVMLGGTLLGLVCATICYVALLYGIRKLKPARAR